MSVLIIHHGESSDLLVASSLLRRYSAEKKQVTVLTDETCLPLAQFMDCRAVSKLNEDRYDTAINISPSIIAAETLNRVSALNKFGYGIEDDNISFLNEGAKMHYQAKYMHKNTTANIFQLVFGLADMTWQGEGYLLKYFPRNRTQKSLTGVAIKDMRLREFVMKNLKLNMSRLWQIPFKQNILKQIDESNRCKQLITDDPTSMHIGLALRKEVEFITTKQSAYKIETFGSGSVFVFDVSGESNAA